MISRLIEYRKLTKMYTDYTLDYELTITPHFIHFGYTFTNNEDGIVSIEKDFHYDNNFDKENTLSLTLEVNRIGLQYSEYVQERNDKNEIHTDES